MSEPSVHPTLAVFKACPRCASTRLARHLGKALRCASCGLELFLNPAAAVGAFISDSQGRTLFLRRAKDPGKGKLGIPGGFTDVSETAEESLRREVLEETGLSLPERLEYVGSWTNVYVYAGVSYATLDFYFHARVESLAAAKALDETDSLVAADPSELDPAELAFDSARKALAKLVQLKRPAIK